jgi:hypothetical protein
MRAQRAKVSGFGQPPAKESPGTQHFIVAPSRAREQADALPYGRGSEFLQQAGTGIANTSKFDV